MKATQDNRLLNFITHLGKDFLLINSFKAQEGLSTLFKLELDLLHDENSEGSKPTIVDPQKILGQPVALQVQQRDGTQRFFHGIVSEFSQGNRDTRFTYYEAVVVPAVWLLTQRVQSRIFQHIPVPEILKKILDGFDVKFEIQGTFHPRDYCVQYRESDFNFISRLMEEEGIYYYFEHTESGHKMIVANIPQSHRDCPSKKEVPFSLNVGNQEDFISSVGAWRVDRKLHSGKYTLWDHSFELPTKKLEAQQPTRFNLNNSEALEVYDFPGGYAQRFDGIDKGGGERAGDLQKIFEDNRRTVQIRMQEIDARYRVAYGSSDCSSLTAGHRFKLFNHPIGENNSQHILLSVEHEAVQSPGYISEDDDERAYSNSFTCILHGEGQPPARPKRATPKPVIHGCQTATVVGPAGEEIFTDKYGRVKAQFHWDREGQYDVNSSCWIRVAQGWAGKHWGSVFIPRVGMEVIVEFLEGDPDQPIIVGCVYNADTMPPYTLPKEKTKMTIKSDSTNGGGGFNELRFEDKKGSEQIFIHGQKDQDIRIKNDRREWIGRDRDLIIKQDKKELVERDTHLQVKGDQSEKVDGTVSLTVGQDLQAKVSSKYAMDAGMEVHIKAGTNMVLETGASLTLKVGSNFININSSGIYIKGTMVMLNSGGAAGSGAGSSPDAPKAPLEADKAEPGSRVAPPPPNPPLKPKAISLMALSMKDAAKKGTPFCEICAK